MNKYKQHSGPANNGQKRDDGTPARNNGQARPGSPGRRTAGNNGGLNDPGQMSGGEEHSGLGPVGAGNPGADSSDMEVDKGTKPNH